MSNADPNLPGENDDELKQAMLAAFGDDALDLLDDGDIEDIPDDMLLEVSNLKSECAHAKNGQNHLVDCSVELPPCLIADENDQPRDAWVKELYRSVYVPGESTAPGDASGSAAGNSSVAIDSRCILFAIGDQKLAISLGDIREIARDKKITELPCTARWLRGVTNLRGQILSVTDTRNLLQIEGPRPNVGEKIIVIHSDERATSTALIVDRIIGIRNVETKQQVKNEFGEVICQFANDWAVIDDVPTPFICVEGIFAATELIQYA